MKQKWYAVPPYKGEGWKVLNNNGEYVATFEEGDECEKVVELYNHALTDKPN